MPLDGIQRQLDELSRRVKFLEQKLTAAPAVSLIIYDKEYDRVLAEMETLRNTYASHQTWAPKDKERLQKLKSRKAELKTLLGITV